ncbi:Receptor-type tyrosine-protein phosphatase gamma, partial [Dissostichus eleginoides]
EPVIDRRKGDPLQWWRQNEGRFNLLAKQARKFLCPPPSSIPSIYGPNEGWSSAYPECRERNQSPINIVDQDTKISTEYQELTLEGFDAESSNKTSMKNTGKT